MGRLIIIQKISEINSIYYYAVFKEDSNDEIQYYMGLDSKKKQIFFFEDTKFECPALCIYDIRQDKFIKLDQKLKKIIGSSPIIKGIKAILSNNFPQDISFRA